MRKASGMEKLLFTIYAKRTDADKVEVRLQDASGKWHSVNLDLTVDPSWALMKVCWCLVHEQLSFDPKVVDELPW